jgi:predicted RNA binding protein YcfA (HicA-like mRNA interferase family)
VPLHKELKRGLLRQILRDANLSSEELTELL